jgi:5-formyltetrahydrofolate cyclo-ligase
MSDLDHPLPDRGELRRQLLDARERFVTSGSAAAQDRLEAHLREVLIQLEPETLGLYWPVRHEFNAAVSLPTFAGSLGARCALPFCSRPARDAALGADPGMHYRLWDGETPRARDACGVPASDGQVVVPDVVIVPCLGFDAAGFRLGYGAGFFDRWLAVHPGVTTVGVAWAVGRLSASQFSPRSHDRALSLVLTEDGVA